VHLEIKRVQQEKTVNLGLRFNTKRVRFLWVWNKYLETKSDNSTENGEYVTKKRKRKGNRSRKIWILQEKQSRNQHCTFQVQ